MKILITGGAGFLGSNLVKKLYKKHELYVIDDLSTGDYNNIKELIKNNIIKFKKISITDSKITEIIKNEKFKMIYNFACPASPKYYLKYPIETFNSSVIGINNILNGIIGTNTRVLHTSTSEIYGDALEIPQKENYFGNCNPIGPRACYDEGKRAAETLIYDYIRLYNLDIRVVRIFNTYGIGMRNDDGRVISNFVNAAIKNNPIRIYGTGNQTRSFCYVDDTIDFIEKYMNSEVAINHPINVGNPSEISIKDLAYKIIKITKSKSKIINTSEMIDDPQRRKPDISCAYSLLKWSPNISLDQGLNKYIDYLLNKKI